MLEVQKNTSAPLKEKEKMPKEIYLRENGSKGVRTIGFTQGKTKQEFKEQCSVKNILDRYIKTGRRPVVEGMRYDDVSELLDYEAALNVVVRADQSFMELPSDIRLRFNNNPRELLDFIADEKNIDEARALGILAREEPVKEVESSEKVQPEVSVEESEADKK